MVRHIVAIEKCRGCGKCVEACGLELWELAETDDGTKKAFAIEEAGEVCHMCLVCRDTCPEGAITIIEE